MHTLVTLLGDPKLNKETGSYFETMYCFEDGSITKPNVYVGLALKAHIKPNRMVVLGTTGSTWHNFVKYCIEEHQGAGVSESQQQLLKQLQQEYEKDAISQATLNEASGVLSSFEQNGCQYVLRLVPYGRNQAEQTETLKVMIDCFAHNDEATLDVSNSLRHLSMLMQQSALLLQAIKNVKVRNIFYGAFHLEKDKKTSIMTLDGILEIDRWSKSLYRYEQDGDYVAFREPLKASGAAEATLKSLDAAAYFERTFNLTKAGIELKKVKQALEATNQSGISSFFTGSLLKHISWSDSVSLQQRQANLAHFYLERGDFVRASIFAVESFITSLLKSDEVTLQQDHDTRKDAKDSFYQDYKNKRQSDRGNIRLYRSFQELSKVRNALAHGTEADQRITHLMVNQQEIEKTLKRLFDKLGIQKNHSAQA